MKRRQPFIKLTSILLIMVMVLSVTSLSCAQCFAEGESDVPEQTQQAGEQPETNETTEQPAQPEPPKPVVTNKGNFNDKTLRTLSNRTVTGKNFWINLRAMLKQKPGDKWYSVVQGGCTDGRYTYQLMVSAKNQKGRVLKVRIKDNVVIKRGPVVDTHHGNGMTYDSRRNRLVVIGRKARRCEVVTINAGTLKLTGKKTVNYSGAGKWKVRNGDGYYGLAAIAYVAKYDVFLALQRTTHDILVLDPDLKVIGFVKTNITARYPGTYQAMDADEKYVYLLLSAYSKNYKKQPYNVIIALDWNSEYLQPYLSRTGSYLGMWTCNNNGSGNPDAAIRIKTPYEAENIYHTTDAKGREHFYLAEYCRSPKYEYVKKRVKVKVKWKKVKRGKRYVWKYKKKYVKKWVRKKIKKKNQQYNYIYDLGII